MSALHPLVLQFLVIVSHIIECPMLADEKVKENETVHALHERAKMIVDMELQHPVQSTPFIERHYYAAYFVRVQSDS